MSAIDLPGGVRHQYISADRMSAGPLNSTTIDTSTLEYSEMTIAISRATNDGFFMRPQHVSGLPTSYRPSPLAHKSFLRLPGPHAQQTVPRHIRSLTTHSTP